MQKKKRSVSNGPGTYNASFLRQPDQGRYLALRRKASLSKEEQAEEFTLLSKAEESRRYVDRFQFALPHFERAAVALRKDPCNPAAQRELLRAAAAPCYPDFFQVEIELVAQGKFKPRPRTAARQGLEGVLYVMDNTVVGDVIEDLDRRVRFLTNLDAMLEPFRKLKADDSVDLRMAFQFRAKGQGNKTQDQLDVTLGEWGPRCFDLHLLHVSGVKITPAAKRVAAVHNQTDDALRSQYKIWREHLVRKEMLSRGDEHVRKFLSRPKYQALLVTAYPTPAAVPRPHRPRHST